MKNQPKPKVAIKKTVEVKKATLDSVDIAKKKSLAFAKQNMGRKDFLTKPSSLSDSVVKYTDKVVGAARKMSPSELIKKNISKKITSKGDTVYKYSSGNTEVIKQLKKKK